MAARRRKAATSTGRATMCGAKTADGTKCRVKTIGAKHCGHHKRSR